jgi:hypothetical protein
MSAGNHFVNSAQRDAAYTGVPCLALASTSFADKNDYWPGMTAKTKATNHEP